MHAVIGKKVGQTQKFLTDGTRIPVTVVATPGNPVVMVKTKDKDGYWGVQLGFGIKKNPTKSLIGHAKKAQLEKAPSLVAEVRFTDKQAEALPQVGEMITASMVFEAGDMVDVSGVSKGKGFAGGVKRYGFHGGPKTHGQSDRWRAPGSLGSGTTPGRVYKGKRMAGKMGNDNVTLKNLEIVEVGSDFVWIKGVVPGAVGTTVKIAATGKKDKKFPGVLKAVEEVAAEETPAEEVIESVGTPVVEETPVAAEAQEVTSEAVDPVATETPVAETEEKVAEEAKEEAPAAEEPKTEEEAK